jgi:hypothetical protein
MEQESKAVENPTTATSNSVTLPNSWACTQLHKLSQQTPTAAPRNFTFPISWARTKTHKSTQQHKAAKLQRLKKLLTNSMQATQSSAWPSDLIPIQGQIIVTLWQHPSNPYFAFDLWKEATNIGRDLQEALLA